MHTQYFSEGEVIRFAGEASLDKRLEAGVYRIDADMQGLFLRTQEIQTESLIDLPDTVGSRLTDHVSDFLTEEKRAAFDRYGLLYKRGVLMYGPPGTGKTSIVNQLIKTAIDRDMVILLAPQPNLVNQVVHTVRLIEKSERPFMVIWEEFENWVYESEAALLNLLDGLTQVSNIFFLATTNYVEKIPSRILNRPSRFAEIIKVDLPGADARRAFLEGKIHKDDDIDIDEWVSKSDGLAIDHLKDLIISVLVMGNTLDESVEKLKLIEALSLRSDHEEKIRALQGELVENEVMWKDEPVEEPMGVVMTAGPG